MSQPTARSRPTSMTRRIRRRIASDDRGAALLTTLFMMAVLSAMAVTVTVISTNNIANTARDRQATTALALSEGGVAQAVSYLRSGNAIRALRCAPDCGTANPWGEKPAPLDTDGFPAQVVVISPGESYEVWIEPISPLKVAPPTPGIYRVHSRGISGGSPGNRTVEVDLEVEPFNYPLAVFADTVIPGGSGSIFNESLFSTGCIFQRDKINFGTGLDVVYEVPPAAHSSQYITERNGTGTSCSATDEQNIHHATKSVGGCSTDPDYHYDQDKLGRNPVGAPCFGKYTSGSTVYPKTSLISDAADLEAQWDFQLEGLTAEQLETLKTAAIEQGFYFTNTTAIPPVLKTAAGAAANPNPILFYDLATPASDRIVDLNDLSFGYSRTWPLAADAPACTGRAALVVVRNGNVRMNSNSVITASVFALGPAPYGEISKLNGTAQLIGTIYGRELDLTGTGDIKLDDCFVENPPGQAVEVRVTDFVEVDRDRVPASAPAATATATPTP